MGWRSREGILRSSVEIELVLRTVGTAFSLVLLTLLLRSWKEVVEAGKSAFLGKRVVLWFLSEASGSTWTALRHQVGNEFLVERKLSFKFCCTAECTPILERVGLTL